MALLKDLIVNGIGRFIGVVHAPKFITDGGTNSQFVKGDGTLDSNTYLTSQDISGKADKSNTTAGTYKSVTVNNQGIVTAGTNPTTLSGYGITDAVTLTGQQTISGLKTFSSGVKLQTASAWDNADRGIPFSDPSDTTKIAYTYIDSNKGLTYNPNTGALKVGSIVKRLFHPQGLLYSKPPLINFFPLSSILVKS